MVIPLEQVSSSSNHDVEDSQEVRQEDHTVSLLANEALEEGSIRTPCGNLHGRTVAWITAVAATTGLTIWSIYNYNNASEDEQTTKADILVLHAVVLFTVCYCARIKICRLECQDNTRDQELPST